MWARFITVSSTGVLGVKVLTFSKIESIIFNMFITLFFVGKAIVFLLICEIHDIVKNSNLFISYILTVRKLVLRCFLGKFNLYFTNVINLN